MIDVMSYTSLDPRAGFSFLIPYVAMKFEISTDELSKPCEVSTPLHEFILKENVNRDCSIFIICKSTMTDLVKLDMLDIDVILGMDWLHACYASIDCRTQFFKLQLQMG